MKRLISFILVFCLVFQVAFAEEEKPKSVWESIGGWFGQAAEDTSNWATQAWEDTSDWAARGMEERV